MKTSEKMFQTLEQLIESIKEDINELKYHQINELMLIHKNHITYMKKLEKLQEFAKIEDMTNQLLEKRLVEIENGIKDVNKYISA